MQSQSLIELISPRTRANVDPVTTMQLTLRSPAKMTCPTPITDTRVEAARRNQEAALSAFLTQKAEIDARLARLQALSDDHFDCHPDEVGWAMVGTLEHYAGLLKRITDSAFGEDECAG